ncbi:hypothetical protein [Fibrobacter intestinalis]|uniref:hypothetical protein n=1 Tax=Fibrobacter sp. NR9 TaxID=1896200 RepID=UPI001304112C|nr:hypothetical protein [Fibrobacter sp. NR9]
MEGLSEYGANRIAVYLHDSGFSAGDETKTASGEYLTWPSWRTGAPRIPRAALSHTRNARA